MSWRMDSSAGVAIWDTEPMSSDDLALRDEEIEWLVQKGRHQWNLINGRLLESGTPTANVGFYSSLNANPPTAAQTSTAVTTVATPGTTIWTVGTYSPLLANAITCPSAYRVTASGTIQTSTTSQTFNVLPSIGTGLGERRADHGHDSRCLRRGDYRCDGADINLVHAGRPDDPHPRYVGQLHGSWAAFRLA